MRPLAIQAALAALLVRSASRLTAAPETTRAPEPAQDPTVQASSSQNPEESPLSFSNPKTPQMRKKRDFKITVDVNTKHGKITGRSRRGVELFNGVPYADPPTGPLRLRPPQRLSRKLDRVDATGAAPACPQMFVSSEARDALGRIASTLLELPLLKQINGQEDCLTVDVARPSGTKVGDKLPVLFWIHGGAFQQGTTRLYDPISLLNTAMSVRQPFVFVAVNYRLGGFGFLAGKEVLRDGSANLGLLDQRMGLEWVADNIEAFGGDPAKVTIWGESAGAISVYNQMLLFGGNASYLGKPLFRGAIMSSGSSVPTDPVDCAKSQDIYDLVVKQAGCSGAGNTLQCLRELPYETFHRACNSPPGFLSYNSVDLSYLPRPDGRILEASPEEMTKQGRIHAVPFISGGQEDEGTIFSILQTNITTAAAMADYLHTILLRGAPVDKLKEYVDFYEPARLQGSPFRTGIQNELYPGFKRMSAILADISFVATRRSVLKTMAKLRPDLPSWSYLSSYLYGTPVVGTFHGSDILQIFAGRPPNNAMMSCRTYYFNFLYNLDPNIGVGIYAKWPQWKFSKELMWFKSGFSNEIIRDDFRSGALAWIRDHAEILRV